MKPLKVLIIDDSVVYRFVLRDVISEFSVTGDIQTASNGKTGIQKIGYFEPDVILTDLEMPEKTGLDVLSHVKQNCPHASVIIVSSLSSKTNKLAMEALQMGALDFIQKPGAEADDPNDFFKAKLQPFFDMLAKRNDVLPSKNQEHTSAQETIVHEPVNLTPASTACSSISTQVAPSNPPFLVIGVSTGGPNALSEVFSQLKPGMKCPILVVQHIPAHFAEVLVERLQKVTELTVKIAKEGEIPQPDTILFSPGGKHMTLSQSSGGEYRIKILDSEPVHGCKPAVDVLLDSMYHQQIQNIIAIIMTGMGRDGTEGVTGIRKNGGYCVIQNEETCVVWGMPKSVLEANQADEITPLGLISNRINRFTH
jgi:two-component system chemotaxis response regulator CheB